MRIRMLTTAIGPTTELREGKVYGPDEVAEEYAVQLVTGGYAVNYDEEQKTAAAKAKKNPK